MSDSTSNSTHVTKRPKLILFDIGGVCVLSPFQIILDTELELGVPPGWINFSISQSAPTGFWHQLERGHIKMDDEFFDGFSRDLHNRARWHKFYKQAQAKNPHLQKNPIPPMPRINAKKLFYAMMEHSTQPDPWMYPALQALRASQEFMLGALSNSVIFPPTHALGRGDFFADPIRSLFHFFVSSAHVGLRKPQPEIYQYALECANDIARERQDDEMAEWLGWEDGIRAEDVLFLDDIGENLKEAKRQGFRTLKVSLGRAYEVVDELERITGLKLAGNHPREPILLPMVSLPLGRAKI